MAGSRRALLRPNQLRPGAEPAWPVVSAEPASPVVSLAPPAVSPRALSHLISLEAAKLAPSRSAASL